MRRFVLVLGLLAACSDDDGGGGGSAIDADAFADAFASKYCDTYVECGLVEDLATCRSLDWGTFIDDELLAAIHAGKVIYHADHASECIAHLAASCDVIDSIGVRPAPEACDLMIEGTVAEGGQCAMSEECISQSCDVPVCPDACCQGTCGPGDAYVRPHVGESCMGDTRCVDGFCEPSTQLCTAYLADGAACTSSQECESGSCIDQACKARASTGEACGSGVAACRLIGDNCNDATMMCTPVGLAGDPCTYDEDCSPIYECDPATSTCRPGPRLGEPCEVISGCIDQSYCDHTTLVCTTPKPDGQPCGLDSQCESGACDPTTNTCIPHPVCI